MIPGRIDKGRRLGNLSDILEFLEFSTFQSEGGFVETKNTPGIPFSTLFLN